VSGALPLPRLEDIGAAMMFAPNPSGYTFESLMPPAVRVGPKKETRH
jgi:hypothetical protein